MPLPLFPARRGSRNLLQNRHGFAPEMGLLHKFAEEKAEKSGQMLISIGEWVYTYIVTNTFS